MTPMPAYTAVERDFYLLAMACGPPLETRFTLTSGINGQGYWYNRRAGAMVGSVVGSLSLQGLGPIDRVGTSAGDLLINKSGGGGFSEWVAANPNFTWKLTFPDQSGDPTIALTAADLDGNPGGSFIRFSLTAAQLNLASNVSTGDSIEVVITP